MPRSAARIVNILGFLAERPDGASLAALAAGLGAPKTSLLSLLRDLAGEGYLRQQEGRYVLAERSFALAAAIIAQRKFPAVAHPILLDLARESGETALLGQLAPDDAMLLYVDRVESENPIRFIAGIGERRPLYATAGGRVILAFQDAAWREDYLSRVQPVAHTARTLVDKAEIRRLLDGIRAEGLASTVDDMIEGVAGFAAPVFGADGRIIASLVIGAPTGRAQAKAAGLSRLVTEKAAAVSRLMGWRKG